MQLTAGPFPLTSIIAPLVLVAALSTAAESATIIYVNAAAIGANDGSSWTHAYIDLQDALGAARAGSEIWIAAGIYAPGPPGSPLDATSFHLVSGVALYGGFAGWERSIEERDWNTNESILSGDLVGDGSQRVHHVLRGDDLQDGTIIDGVTVRDGFPGGLPGAGLRIEDSTIQVVNCTFRDNWAISGGAIYAHGSSVALTECFFLSNNGVEAGGAAYVANSYLTLDDCVFDDNQAVTHGGGVVAENSILIGTNVTFLGNDAHNAAALLLHGSAVILDQCVFIDNTAIGTTLYWHPGGGSLHIKNCSFKNNASEAPAIWLENASGDLLVENSLFRDNRGGIYVVGGSSSVTVAGSDFIDNDARSEGGAIELTGQGNVFVIEDCIFENNFSSFGGGAIALGGSTGTVRNSRMLNNTAATSGGGISALGSLTLINVEISGNEAIGNFGGGIEHRAGDLTMINCKVADNFPDGVAVGSSFGPTDATIINSTIAHNGVDLFPRIGSHTAVLNSILSSDFGASCEGFCGGPTAACWCDELCCTVGDCCFDKFLHCGGCEPEVGTVEVSHSIVKGLPPHDVGDDPLFVNPSEGDFRLQPSSPAIDAGSNAFLSEDITTDLDGNPRIVDGNKDGNAIVDMGAYEFHPADDPKEPCIFADLNCDGVVNVEDLLLVLDNWGPCPPPPDERNKTNCPWDLTGDGVVDIFDLLKVLANWG